MKKTLLSLIAAAASVGAVAQDAAEPTVFTIDGITYEVPAGQTEATITGFDADQEFETLALTNPVKYGDVSYTLASLPAGTDNRPGLLAGLHAKNIVLDNVVLSPYSFYGNGNIESVVFTSTPVAAGNPLQDASYAFADCRALTEVSAADATDITSLPEAIFSSCTALTTVTFPATLTEIGAAAFYDTSLGNITFPASLTAIGQNAFNTSTSTMTRIELPASVVSVGESAFAGSYDDLTNITIKAADGESGIVRTYGADAFAGSKSKLTAIVAYPLQAPVAAKKLFSDDVYKNVKLGLLEDADKNSYNSQEGWMQFIQNGTTGAGIIAADGSDTVLRVYDINGVLRMTTTSRCDIPTLPAGLYIVNGVKTIVK